jgi:hypothetical protein
MSSQSPNLEPPHTTPISSIIKITLTKHLEPSEVLEHFEVHMDNGVLEMVVGLGTSMYTSALLKCKCKTSSTFQHLRI